MKSCRSCGKDIWRMTEHDTDDLPPEVLEEIREAAQMARER